MDTSFCESALSRANARNSRGVAKICLMKAKQLIMSGVTIIVATAAAFYLLNGQGASADPYPVYPPTPAPTPTPGEPVFSFGPTSVPLPQPLLTPEQALEQALYYDSHSAHWEHPWSLDTPTLEPGRITVEAFPSRTAESADAGRNE